MDLIVKAKVKHNGKWYEPGDEIKKVRKEDGERLVNLGVAKVDEEAAAHQKAEEEAKLAAEKAKKETEEKAKSEAKKEDEKK